MERTELDRHCQHSPCATQSSNGNVIAYEPPTPERTKKRKFEESSKELQTTSGAFLQHLPTAQQWNEKQEEFDLIKLLKLIIMPFTRDDNLNQLFTIGIAFAKFTEDIKKVFSKNDDNLNELLTIGIAFAKFTEKFQGMEEIFSSIYYSCLLILLSYCEVLRSLEYSDNEIDNVAKHGISSREKDRRKLLKRSGIVHKTICELTKRGWTIYRSTDFFLLYAMNVSQLRDLNDRFIHDALGHLTTDKYPESGFNYSPGHTLPRYVYHLINAAGTKLSLDRTYAALKYDPTVVPVEDRSNPTTSLLLLLYSLGCSKIQKTLLIFGLSPQERWNDEGNIEKITLPNVWFDQPFVHLFSSKEDLEQAIQSCVKDKMIIAQLLEDKSLAYSLADEWRIHLSRSWEQTELVIRHLLFIAHIYPREEALHGSFRNAGKLMLPYLERLWEYLLKGPLPTLPKGACGSLAEASLAASRLTGGNRSSHAMSVAAKMQKFDIPNYLQLAISYRQSVMFRLKGDYNMSDVLIRNALATTPAADTRSHCLRGYLLLSHTENAIMRNDFSRAADYLRGWEARNDPPSVYELQVIRLKNTVHGRVSRYEGDFQHARGCLESCFTEAFLPETTRYHIMHHLADVYCELKLPLQVQNLLGKTIEDFIIRDKQQLRGFRRLFLPWAEAFIQQHSLQAARKAFVQLSDIFDSIVDPDISDQLDHVRSILGLMRVAYYESRWPEALESSEKAYLLMHKYNTFADRDFYIGIVLMFRTVIYHELRQSMKSQEAFQSAQEYDQGPRHYMPGMGTYVLHSLRLRVESVNQMFRTRMEIRNLLS